MDDDVKPGSGGRPPGCLYFAEDHKRAFDFVREKAPQVFEWIEAHPEGLPGDVPMHQLMWQTTMEILPKATLIDHAEVALLLRKAAEEKRWEDALRRQKED